MSKFVEELSFIVLTWNSEKYVETCIRSVFKDAENCNLKVEVYAVDNGSKDKTLEIIEGLRSSYGWANIMKLGRNCGTTVSRNIVIQKCKANYIFILDSDTEVKEGALKELIRVLNSDTKIGIVAPRLLYWDGTVQPSCKKFPTVFVKLFKGLPIGFLNKVGEKLELYDKEVYSKEFKNSIEVDYCISAAWMIRREAIEDVGLLDENIFYSPEDVDYCLRMWLKGWKVVYAPKAEIVHHTQRISHTSFKMALLHAEGLIYYFLKHRYLFSRKKIYTKIRRCI